MWITGKQAGLSDQDITIICNQLWEQAQEDRNKKCPDCRAGIGQRHHRGCDVARCVNCGQQALSCDCGMTLNDVWDGLWPYTQYCYDNRLIAKMGVAGVWHFDYNTASRMNAKY